MKQIAVLVDAGYFWVQLSFILFGEKREREQTERWLQPEKMREYLFMLLHREFPSTDLLRVYWYDGLGTDGNPTKQHRAIAELDNFKVCFGTRNAFGQQKGVDGLLIADLINLAQCRSITDALIVSGDADLTPGVLAAQNLGIRVHRLELGPPEASSPVLRAEADKNLSWPRSEIEKFVSDPGEPIIPLYPQLTFTSPSLPTFLPVKEDVDETVSAVAEQFFEELSTEAKERVCSNGPIPADEDKKLLFLAKTRLGRLLDPAEKIKLREAVKQVALRMFHPSHDTLA